MWITPKIPGAPALGLTTVNEEPVNAESPSDRAVAEVEAGPEVEAPPQVSHPPEDDFLAPKKVHRPRGTTPPIANFFGSNSQNPHSGKQVEAGKSPEAVKITAQQKQVSTRAAQREAAAAKKKSQKAAEKEK